MSVDDSDSHSGRKRKVNIGNAEDWGDDVSIISRSDKPSVGTIILKISLGIIFIGSATGAIVYSVINSEESQNQSVDANTTLYFPYDIDQECFNGTLTMMYRKDFQNGQQQYQYVYYGTDWVQDATKKRLYHRTKRRCTKMDQGYADFLESMGLTYIRKKRDEKVQLNGHYREVMVYEGEPPDDVSINGKHPSLIRGYSSVQRNVTYGWELYFSHTTNFSLFAQEYWYPSMRSRKPDWSIFNDIPNECLNS
ncbi:hypothetical protein RB195_019336 [Necator americanus]|uniref:Uncharacterized protein n=1 Tax=Necator americanus TaxID=51031 RepID=A0ABR1CDP4_NECAM